MSWKEGVCVCVFSLSGDVGCASVIGSINSNCLERINVKVEREIVDDQKRRNDCLIKIPIRQGKISNDENQRNR